MLMCIYLFTHKLIYIISGRNAGALIVDNIKNVLLDQVCRLSLLYAVNAAIYVSVKLIEQNII